jgi:hypothetical protein
MSANLNKFFRNTPPQSLQLYFQSYPSVVSEAVNWNKPPKNIATPLLKAIDELSDDEKAVHYDNAERVDEMTDEIGQNALLSVVSNEDREAYESLEGEHDRALFVFLRDGKAFSKAENIRKADAYRKGQMWNGFVGPKDITVSNNEEDIMAFKQKVVDYFRISGNVKVEVFTRDKPYEDGKDLKITHIMVYHEDFPTSFNRFKDSETIVPEIIRPVVEMTLTYEPESGSIEVIAKGAECREAIAKMLSETLLHTEIDGERIPLKQYNISHLLNPFKFPTDPDDGIESVKVQMLMLNPQDSYNKITLEVTAKEQKTIYDISNEWFDINDPLRKGFKLAKVKFIIHFAPDSESGRGRNIAVTISHPNGCDLKGKTHKEQLIGNKYLKKWGILKEI